MRTSELTGQLVATLNKEDADARAETAKIEKAVAWRRLTPKQAANIASALKTFAGQKINVFTFFGDLEGWVFADQIEKALGGKDGAGWNVKFARITWSPRTFSGMVVETTPLASDKDREAARALALALSAEHFIVMGPILKGEAVKGEAAVGDADPQTFLDLTVGVHPEPQVR